LKTYLLDASVAARFLLTEDLSNKAEEVLSDFLNGKINLTAPPLIVYEVGNTLWNASARKFIKPADAEEKLKLLLNLDIQTIELNTQDHLDILKLSINQNATYYDSIYIKSAEKTNSTLLTADDTLIRKASDITQALHLKDYT
jgi:predicted nucleic acid-binding protein